MASKAQSKTVESARDLFLWDYDSTLFPLALNRLMVDRYADEMDEFIQETVLPAGGTGFLPQQRVFASKSGWHLRRTVKLDPVAEFFWYGLIYKNRARFRKPLGLDRNVFGFRIVRGEPLPTVRSYANFKASIAYGAAKFDQSAYFDIASYFNHIYHHDLVRWFEEAEASPGDVEVFGRFLREISSGRSVDCLPQGLYPSKMVGSAFLSFLEASNRIRSARMVRLMDDVWLFDDQRNTIVSDALRIQALLGDRGLSINVKKSAIPHKASAQEGIPSTLDEMKVKLLRRRREAMMDDGGYGEPDDEETTTIEELTEEEQEYLLGLLNGSDTTEEDAELVLSLMRDSSEDLMSFLPTLIQEFPALAKRTHHFCRDVPDIEELAKILLRHTQGDATVPEEQLFWFAKMAEDYLLKARSAGSLLQALFEHEQATDITRAKILEISTKKFGLPELREEQLRSAPSGWLGWAAAVGSRGLAKGQRNHLLKYFRKASPMNRLVGEFVESRF